MTLKMSTQQRTTSVLDWPSQSSGLKLIENAFHILQRRLKLYPPPPPRNKQEESNSLVMSMSRRLDAVIANKGLCNQILNVIYFKTICSFTFAHLKMGWSDTKGGMLVNCNTFGTKLLSFIHHRVFILPAINMADARLMESKTLHLLGLTFSTDLKWIMSSVDNRGSE